MRNQHKVSRRTRKKGGVYKGVGRKKTKLIKSYDYIIIKVSFCSEFECLTDKVSNIFNWLCDFLPDILVVVAG